MGKFIMMGARTRAWLALRALFYYFFPLEFLDMGMELILGHLIGDMDPFFISRILVSLLIFFSHDENKQVTKPDVCVFPISFLFICWMMIMDDGGLGRMH